MEFKIEDNVVNKSVLNELKPHFSSPMQKIANLIIVIAFIVVGVVFSLVYARDITLFIISLAVAALLIVIPIFQKNQAVKLVLQRMQESKGTDQSVYNILLTEGEFAVFNEENFELEKYQYSDFKRFAQTKNLYALFTKTNQLIVINKESMNLAENQNAFAFLKERCINIKKWK